jgi:hypothetical protein
MVSAAFTAASRAGVKFAHIRKRFQDGFATFIQVAQLLHAVADGGHLHLIQAAGYFLAVTGDKGHGSALV